MKKRKAIRLAIEAMKLEIRRLNVDANLHEMCGLDSPGAISASKKRAELREAIALLSAQNEQMEMIAESK